MKKKGLAKRNILNLILGIAFFSYGSYRLYTFYEGAPYSNFRLIVAIGILLIGIFDIYNFFRKRKASKKEDL